MQTIAILLFLSFQAGHSLNISIWIQRQNVLIELLTFGQISRCEVYVIAIFSFLPKHPDLVNYKFCSSIAIAYLHFIELFFESQTKFWMAIGNQNASIWIHDSFATDFYGLLCRNINWYTVLACFEMILYLPMEIRESKYILSESKENIRCVPTTLKSTFNLFSK